VTASIVDFQSALRDVPVVLLSEEDRRVLDDTHTSLEALTEIDIVPTAVAFVGCSGSGKSAIVNAAAGATVSLEGVVRPTTTNVIMAGSSGPVSLPAQSEYVHSPAVRSGVLLVDTPPWEHDPRSVRSAINVSDLVVVVATPSRYADASLVELVDSIPQHRPAAVVLNRVNVTGDELDQLLDSVREAHGADVTVIAEGGEIRPPVEQLLAGLDIDNVGYERGAVLRSAASSGGRFVATAVASVSTSLGSVATAVTATSAGEDPRNDFTVLEDWASTRRELVRVADRMVREFDDAVIESSVEALVRRLWVELGRWDSTAFEHGLDDWYVSTTEAFVAVAKTPWWRRSIDDQVARVAWRVSVNPTVAIPSRIERSVGPELGVVAAVRHSALVDLYALEIQSRRDRWNGLTSRLGEYAPGRLFSIARAFGDAQVEDA
jgi:hypothetical protein